MKSKSMNRKGQRGFVLIMTGFSIIALVGMMGLAIDLGRMYIVKNESQTFCDLTALAAGRQIDGTQDGIDRARTAVSSSQMKYNFGTANFSDVTTLFSTDNTYWTSYPSSQQEIKDTKYVLVQTAVGITLYFMPVLQEATAPGVGFLVIGNQTTIRARAVSGHKLIEAFIPGGIGTLPFAPLAHDPADPNFGFHQGDIITLRWPSSVQGNKKFCSADDAPQWVDQSTLGGGDERGYIQETSGDAIREAIEDDKIFYTVTLGEPVQMTGGVKQAQRESLETRAAQDVNTFSTTYQNYLNHPHNERRIGVVPIVHAQDNFRVIGFAKVFLPMSQSQGGNHSLCAEYVGNYYLQGADENGSPGTGVGAFEVKLFQ